MKHGIVFLFLFLGAGCGTHPASTPPPQTQPPIVLHPSSPTPKTAIVSSRTTLAGFVPSPVQIERTSRDKSLFALTFDAGSNADAVFPILKELKSRNVLATFFLTGKFCERYPKECRAIADAGMEVGNHSYSHPAFTKLTDGQIREQLERAEMAIVKACGRGAKPIFRYPFGAENARVREAVARCGYQAIYWSVDSLDAFREEKTADFVVNRYEKRLQGGQISLMHVSSLGSAHALPRLFTRLEKLGLKQVPVSEIVRETIQAKREKSRELKRG